MPNHRKPRTLKLLQNTHRPSRDTANPWTPTACLPEPPGWLSDVALQEWHRIGPKLLVQGVIAESDLIVFAAYCAAVGNMVDAETILKAIREKAPKNRGLTKRTKNGNIIHNPAYTIAKGARAEAVKLGQLLGLTPVDRDRVNRIEQQPEDATAARFFE